MTAKYRFEECGQAHNRKKTMEIKIASWVKGEAPLKRILMLWNGKALFGPMAFQTEEHRDQETQRLIATTARKIAGAPTHYLIIPKPE